MITLKVLKDLTSKDENFSILEATGDNLKHETYSFKLLEAKKEDGSKKPVDFTNPAFLNQNNPNSGILQTIKQNFSKISYLGFMIGVFVGIGSFSKKYC